MKKLLPALSALVGLLAFGLTACSSGGGGGGSFQIVSCSLGCAGSGAGGDGQVSCGIQNVFVNGELRIAFNDPIDEDSLSVFSVQVTQIGSGKTPPATRFVDPNDPTILVYRPKLSFDSSGAPIFGLTAGASYTIKLPGVVEDPGSQFVRNENGSPNRHRMLCTVEASLGILDLKPGPPTVAVTVDKVTAYDPGTGEPSAFELDVPAQGEVDVYRFSQITMTFDDVMNPATLVNPVSGKSPSIQVLVDPDGNTADPSDQELVIGTFTILLNQDELKTTVTFTSELGFPSAGTDPVSKRKIVVKFLPSISDLGGNPLSNGNDVVFTPEFVAFEQVTLSESFDTKFNEQIQASGGDWGGLVPSVLLPGVAGGSGRLGHLFVPAGQILTLNTDFEDFSGITDPNMFAPANVLDATFDGTTYTFAPVTDGLFEFASLELRSGSKLQFLGSQPARVLVRGEMIIQGQITVAGGNALTHDDKDSFGQPGGAAGPGGGAGGDGGRQPSWVNFEGVQGVVIPDPLVTPPTLAEVDGQDGEDVPDNLLTPTGMYGAGEGGLRWPSPTPANPGFHLPENPSDLSGLIFDIFFCETKMSGGSGGGGAFALNGGNSQNKPLVPTPAPAALGGLASDFGLGIGSDPESPERKLSPEQGHLHGGAGGGGGGGHVERSRTDGQLFGDCTMKAGGAGPASIVFYSQHSGTAGGGGGGAMQAQAGRRVLLDGRIDASGGLGGDKLQIGSAAAGGAGAGGALLMQSQTVQIASAAERINVSGGEGGFGIGGSLGGDGGAGLLRMETRSPVLTLVGEADKFLPSADDLATVGATLDDVFSFGQMPIQVSGPGSLSGVQSCWLRPDGNFFVLTFLEDDGADLGWDMTIIPNPPSLGPQSFRGENDLFGSSLEDLLGNELGMSPIVVLFQGARVIKQVDNFCDLDLGGEDSPLAPGSLTGWVSNPMELNTFFADSGMNPNMIRFKILFDRSNPFMSSIGGVDEIVIQALPD